METGCKPTTPNDYEHLRDRIDAAKILWCTAGGQAVNLWALHYINAHPLIAGLSPFTSKDIDPLIISLRNTEKCPELKVTSWINNSAVSGVVSNHTGHLGELLKFLPGVPDGQWIDRIRRLNGWPIVPPDALYATKCWNLLNVPQKGRNDLRHLILLNYILETHLTQVTEEERALSRPTSRFQKHLFQVSMSPLAFTRKSESFPSTPQTSTSSVPEKKNGLQLSCNSTTKPKLNRFSWTHTAKHCKTIWQSFKKE
jgi:hypothetical protein